MPSEIPGCVFHSVLFSLSAHVWIIREGGAAVTALVMTSSWMGGGGGGDVDLHPSFTSIATLIPAHYLGQAPVHSSPHGTT